MNNRFYKTIHEDRYRNGICLRVEQSLGKMQRVSVILDRPIESYENIGSQTEVDCLLRSLSDKYGALPYEHFSDF